MFVVYVYSTPEVPLEALAVSQFLFSLIRTFDAVFLKYQLLTSNSPDRPKHDKITLFRHGPKHLTYFFESYNLCM